MLQLWQQGDGWARGAQEAARRAQPIEEEDEAQQEVKSQHLSLSQLLQVRGSFPRLSAGVRHWGKAVRGWGARTGGLSHP